MEKKTIAVWFSCGAASAVAAKRAVEIYSNNFNILIVNNPIDEEDVEVTHWRIIDFPLEYQKKLDEMDR